MGFPLIIVSSTSTALTMCEGAGCEYLKVMDKLLCPNKEGLGLMSSLIKKDLLFMIVFLANSVI